MFFIVFFITTLSSACAQESKHASCELKTLEQYKKYRKFLNEGEVTINSFNLEYLQSELKSNNVPKEQIIKRLSKYTFMLDQRQLLVSNIKSYYVACDKVKSQIV